MSWPSRADLIEHGSAVPLWRQVADDIAARIESGELPPGARLPAELELAEIYGVARGTVRRAALELRKDSGVLVVSRGLGTFVARER
ncbi:GntR family transcriptional regulator [Actinophytocola sediminis]